MLGVVGIVGTVLDLACDKRVGSDTGFEGETEGNSVDVTKMVVKPGPSELIV